MTNDTHALEKQLAQMSQSHVTFPLELQELEQVQGRCVTGKVDGFLSPPAHAAFSVSVDVNVLLLTQR